MIDIPLIGKILGGAYKFGQQFKDKKEEEQMREIADDLRRSARANAGNCLQAEIGSDRDRLYSKMVTKNYLVRTPLGYMLPEYVNWGRGRFASRFQ